VDYQYEKLDVWQKAVDFTIDIISTVTDKPETMKHQRIAQALEESATEIAAGIAEGKSFASRQDFTRHLHRSRGSVYKTMTLLEIFRRNNIISEEQYTGLDASAQRLTAMLSALIKSIAAKKSDHVKQAS
jgi:four helix bundle protein